jgi:hypothetical protein
VAVRAFGALALDNVRKLIGIHRRASRHRCGADLPRSRPLASRSAPMVEVWE